MMKKLNGLDVNIDEIQYIIDKYHSGQNIIVVTGEFSSGKSSFINCYLNKPDFLPSGKTECTPLLIDIFEGAEQSIQVRGIDGSVSEVEYTAEKIYELAKYDSKKSNDILSIDVPVENSGLPLGTHLIDTPGTNTVFEEHERITNYIIKKSDAVLYLFNKVISLSDIKHIKNVMQFTKNIIYIVTHTDEIDNKTGEKYTQDGINRLVEEAKKELSNSLEIEKEDIIMCSVGSIDGYDDRKDADYIKAIINGYVKTQTKEKRKNIAAKKIEAILQTAIDSYSLKKELLQKQSLSESDDLERKIEKCNKEQEKYEQEQNNRINAIERDFEKHEDLCKIELYRLLDDEKNTIMNELLSPNQSENEIKTKIDKINKAISSSIRETIEKSVNDISKKIYCDANESLKQLVEDFDLSATPSISAPEIKDLNDSRLVANLVAVENKIEATKAELRMIRDNSNEQEKIEIENQICQYESQQDEMRRQLDTLKTYRPQYIETYVSGGGDTGKLVGRVVGEVADLALLFWNPAGAASGAAKGAKAANEAAKAAKGANEAAKGASKVLTFVKAADKAKDTTTALRYIKDATLKAKTIASTCRLDEAAKAAEEAKKRREEIANTIKKVDNGRRNAINLIQDNYGGGNDNEFSLSNMLDMLSIGHWTQKLGGAIGNAISPSYSILTEDMEIRNEYEQKKDEINYEINQYSSEIAELKTQLINLNDFGKQMRLEEELKAKELFLEEKKRTYEYYLENNRKSNEEQQIKQHFENELQSYEESQKEDGERLIHLIFNEAKLRLVERLTIDYSEKIDSINDIIKDLTDTSIEKETKIKEYEQCIYTLSENVSQIGMWLE